MATGGKEEVKDIRPAAGPATLESGEGRPADDANKQRQEEEGLGDDSEPEEDEDDEEALAEKFAEAFNQVDIDSEGSILAEQLGAVLECLGMVVGQDELEEMIADMTDEKEGGSGVILLDDFVEVMIARHKGQELSDDELKEAFSVFDVDDIGFITAKDVRAVLLLLLDLQTDPKEVEDMFQATTKDPQGRVTFEEFRDIIRWKPPSTKIDRVEQEAFMHATSASADAAFKRQPSAV